MWRYAEMSIERYHSLADLEHEQGCQMVTWKSFRVNDTDQKDAHFRKAFLAITFPLPNTSPTPIQSPSQPEFHVRTPPEVNYLKSAVSVPSD
ncbi:uncharacterized protein RSE6_03716 [Rhynchosporium secalis]|uniref:Uncharacterized protein n=1 Tax=Rhynchosporium secalis TaxID=38038 RepID=A0A1E1M3G8_RHYSE|nr:uncharacterized protein RSE6_03716 [Rhynchosporium secalis]